MENIARPPLKEQTRQSSKRPSSSLDIIVNNEDLIISILHRLPLKSLMRFKSVSKNWHDMITNPHRPDSCYSYRMSLLPQLPLPSNCGLLGFFTNVKCEPYVPYNDDMEGIRGACLRLMRVKYPLRVAASSKGILLCTGAKHKTRVFCVCNPLTGQEVQLPKLNLPLFSNFHEGIAVDCEVVSSAAGISVMHYVVVLACNRFMYVFSSREGCPSWRKLSRNGLTSCVYFPSRMIECKPVVVIGGVCYWRQGRYSTHITACALKEGSASVWCWKIEPPATSEDCHENVHLGKKGFQSNGDPINQRLYYGASLGRLTEIRVWVYKTSNTDGDHSHGATAGQWELKHTVSLQELAKMYPNMFQVKEEANGSQDYSNRLDFEGFHPCLPGIIFFKFQDNFFSYCFKNKKLKLQSSSAQYARCSRVGFIPFEWSPWPHLLSESK